MLICPSQSSDQKNGSFLQARAVYSKRKGVYRSAVFLSGLKDFVENEQYWRKMRGSDGQGRDSEDAHAIYFDSTANTLNAWH